MAQYFSLLTQFYSSQWIITKDNLNDRYLVATTTKTFDWDDIYESDTFIRDLMLEYDLVQKDYPAKKVHFYKVMYFDISQDAVQAAFAANSFVFNNKYGVTYDARGEEVGTATGDRLLESPPLG